MFVDRLGALFAVAGLALGYALGGATSAVFAGLFGFFLVKVGYSLTRTVEPA